jgi:two-component system response regulator YesN
MIRYIHENYAQDIRLAELAEKVYISRNYLSTIFRNATGETFNDYVTRVRMEKAKNLLLEGKLMVYEVADQVGYKNVPYFTTLFKKYTGRNPTEFVKK